MLSDVMPDENEKSASILIDKIRGVAVGDTKQLSFHKTQVVDCKSDIR